MDTETLPNVNEIEDGEIENDEDEEQDNVEIYVPLERPHIPLAETKNSGSENEDNVLNESSSDSDSSTEKNGSNKTKKKKMFLQIRRSGNIRPKKRNYSIWCNELQTEVLSSNLEQCDVNQFKDRTRDVESYNYMLHANNKYPEAESQKRPTAVGKRNHKGSHVDEKRKNKKAVSKSDDKSNKGATRRILDLTVTVNDSESDIAKDIANKLYEEKEELVMRALNILGKEPVISLFEETKKIEEEGGMLIMNGIRRRTPGGVFFYLLKTSTTLPSEKINLVFIEDKKVTLANKKRTAREIQRMKSAKLKEALDKDDFPTLLSRTELAIKQFKARKSTEESGEVKNPPPSPATDGQLDNSSDGEYQQFNRGGDGESGTSSAPRELTTYDDDIFGGVEDHMDIV